MKYQILLKYWICHYNIQEFGEKKYMLKSLPGFDKILDLIYP